MVNAKFVVSDPVTIVHSASLNPVVITFLIGLAVTTILVARRVTGALMIGIIFTTVIAIPIGRFWGDGTAYWARRDRHQNARELERSVLGAGLLGGWPTGPALAR